MGREPERIPGLSVEADRRGRFQSAFQLNAAPGPAFGLADGRRLPSARQGRSYKHSERAHDEMIPVHPKKAKSRRHYFNILRGSFTTPVPRGVCLDDFQTNTRKQKRGSSQSSSLFYFTTRNCDGKKSSNGTREECCTGLGPKATWSSLPAAKVTRDEAILL